MTEITLLPCPFCGSDEINNCGADGSPLSIVCRNCCAEMPYMSLDNPQSVRWNTRHSTSTPLEGQVTEALREAVATAIAQRMERSHNGYDLARAAIAALSSTTNAVEPRQRSRSDYDNVDVGRWRGIDDAPASAPDEDAKLDKRLTAIIFREFGKLPNYRGPDDPCDDPVEQGYGNALTNVLAALSQPLSGEG